MNEDITYERDADGNVLRRTLVVGAGWTIPVVALATATPAAAASASVVLTFDQPAYQGTACTRLNGVSVTATTAGEASPNTPVTVVLANGYTFEDGTTSFSGVTSGNGSLALPPVRVPAAGGSSSFVATSGAASGTASVAAPLVSGGFGVYSNGTVTAAPGVPAGSSPVYAQVFLTPSGNIVAPNGAVTVANVDSVGQAFNDGGSWSIPVKFRDGTFGVYKNGTVSPAAGVPAGSTPLYAEVFLTPAGDIVAPDGHVTVSNVGSVGQPFNDGGGWSIPLEFRDGTFGVYGNGTVTAAPGVPAGSTPLYAQVFLSPTGDIVTPSGTVTVSNVDSIGQAYNDSSSWSVPIKFRPTACAW